MYGSDRSFGKSTSKPQKQHNKTRAGASDPPLSSVQSLNTLRVLPKSMFYVPFDGTFRALNLITGHTIQIRLELTGFQFPVEMPDNSLLCFGSSKVTKIITKRDYAITLPIQPLECSGFYYAIYFQGFVYNFSKYSYRYCCLEDTWESLPISKLEVASALAAVIETTQTIYLITKSSAYGENVYSLNLVNFRWSSIKVKGDMLLPTLLFTIHEYPNYLFFENGKKLRIFDVQEKKVRTVRLLSQSYYGKCQSIYFNKHLILYTGRFHQVKIGSNF